ncbi:MAG: hypothetical protein ABI459_04205 [Deltaproteobacteria bacterium]
MKPDIALRIILTIAGAVAGLSGWLIVDYLPDYLQGHERLVLSIATFLGLFFAIFLVATGPLRPFAAVLAALIVAVPATILLVTASWSYDNPFDYLETGLPLVALLIGTGIAVPFTITTLSNRGTWSDYPTLFTEAWNIFTRATAALVFTGIVWAVILMSDQLLRLVGLSMIGDLLKYDAVPALLTGAALGLALAVVHELSAYVTPYLILRLLRLLLPLVLVVSLIFLIALPIRGLNGLFGNFSSAFVLMSIAFGALTLVTVALDQRDEDGVDVRWMQLATRALALLVPALAAMAVYAVALRVANYGWTPERLAAMSAALVLLGYGLAYGVAVVRGARWMYLIRRANVWMALATLGLAALWLTPLLNAERISVNSQLARLESGAVPVAAFDLWPVGRAWGRASTLAVARMKEMNLPEQATLDTRLVALEKATYRFDFENGAYQPPTFGVAEARATLAKLTVLPAGESLPFSFEVQPELLRRISAGCANIISGQPGCLAIVGDFLTDQAGPEVMFAYFEYGYSGQVSLAYQSPAGLMFTDIGSVEETDFLRLRAGDYTIAPPAIQTLTTGNVTLTPRP